MQTGARQRCLETGKWKNCNSWAEYESPQSSTEAALCNGGRFDGNTYDRCDSAPECHQATEQKLGKRMLTVLPSAPQERPFMGSKVVASSPATGDWRDKLSPWSSNWNSLPTKPQGHQPVQGHQPIQGSASPQGQPQHVMAWPVIPPRDWPGIMQTPYVGSQHGMMGVSPTWLPVDGEGIFTRLGKNMVQGMVAGGAWQVFDFARSVDMFR